MTVIDVIFYGESQFKFELNVMSFICLLGTVFLQHLRAELIMGPKFSVFIFVLCLYALMVSQAQSQGRRLKTSRANVVLQSSYSRASLARQ